jgi:DNA modification methylase
MLGEQGFNNNADNYWDGWDAVLKPLRADCDSMGWDASDIKRICGVGMYCHWFTESQWTFIPENHYKKLQEAALEHDAFKREHDDLKREHDDLKRDFYATRAFFDNTHDNMTDAWEFPRVMGEERHGHATPKPVAMMERVMKSSLPVGGLCVEPFGGSGSTLMGAEKTGRACYTMELQEKYCDVIIKRWEDFTGNKAEMITDEK